MMPLKNNNIDCGIHENELIRLMDEIQLLVREIGEESPQLYYYNISKSYKTPNEFNFLSPLLHTICNNSKMYLHSQMNEKDYSLPFPLLERKASNDHDYKLIDNDTMYSFLKNDFPHDLPEYIITKDYVLYKQKNGLLWIKVKDEDLKTKSQEDIIEMVLTEMKSHVEKVKLSHFFYKAFNYISYGDKAEEDIFNQFVTLLKGKEDLLKIITVLADEKVQKPLFDQLNDIGIKINLEDPVELLVFVNQSLDLCDMKENSETETSRNLKKDLLKKVKVLNKERNTSNFYKYILTEKLKSELPESLVQKKLKI